MIVFVLSLLFCQCIANQLNFEIGVIEKGTRYIQKVQTNLYTNHVYYSTPAHNDIAESHKIQDFNKGMQITCIPSLQECHLMSIDTTTYQNAGNLTESIVHMWNNGINTIVDENSTLIQQHVTLFGTEIINTAFLSQEMRKMLQTFRYPLYRTKLIPDGAAIVNYPLKANHTLSGRSIQSQPLINHGI
ncbi:uncharacterized protein LOC134266048 [Saccostrea cucullata]|uniref:uncharacterized protein LOC134266048 n=1 Tax=Saccostrea cuccullata TaxID=36930 RepID=UPI002ED36490